MYFVYIEFQKQICMYVYIKNSLFIPSADNLTLSLKPRTSSIENESAARRNTEACICGVI